MYSARVSHPAMQQGESKGLTVLLYGKPGSWKTTWCAQWPGVVFISIVSEGGDAALNEYPAIAKWLMDNAQTKEIPPVFNDQLPPKFPVRTCKDFTDAIETITKNARAWNVCTVVVDGLSQLIDIWLRELVEKKEKDRTYQKQKDKRGGDLIDQQAWGFLNHFLGQARVDLHNFGLNVIWTTFAAEKYSPPDPHGDRDLLAVEPMISGRNKVMLPGQCQLWICAERNKVIDPSKPGMHKIVPKYLTQSTNTIDLRHKFYNKFPQGCLVDPDFGTLPTFRAVYYELHNYIYLGQ